MADVTWHGYPQHPGSHPTRPWWRIIPQHPNAWRRLDGEEVRGGPHDRPERVLHRVDAAFPLPPPPPTCGQVWAWPEARHERTLCGVDRSNNPPRAWWAGPPAPDGVAAWPPPRAVLVAGPCSPWAPMGDDDR